MKIKYSGGDSTWGVKQWDKDCMSFKGEGYCCTAHFITAGHAQSMITKRADPSVNAVIFGSIFPEYMHKAHACVHYITTKEREFLDWCDSKLSDVLPRTDIVEKVSPATFAHEFDGSVPVVDILLRDRDSLNDVQSLIHRALGEHGPPATEFEGVDSPASESTFESDSDPGSVDDSDSLSGTQLSASIPSEPIPPTPTSWVYCIHAKWMQVTSMREFTPDPSYKLLFVEDGNILRIKVAEIEAGRMFHTGDVKPTTKPPNVCIGDVFSAQIYIYQCLDGYYEFDAFRALEIKPSPVKVPFLNRMSDYDCIMDDPLFGLTASSLTQMIEAGQITIPTDVEHGTDLLDRIFKLDLNNVRGSNGKSRKRVAVSSSDESDDSYEDEVSEESDDTDSSSEDEESSSEAKRVCKRRRKKQVMRYPRIAPTIPSKRGIQKVRCTVPDENGMCYSGVVGVNWKRPRPGNGEYFPRWHAMIGYRIGGKQLFPLNKSFPVYSFDPVDIDRVCDEAIRYVQETLLPHIRMLREKDRLRIQGIH